MNPLPGGEIVPALDRGLIDAAEFNNASSDRVLGFPDVAKNCMLQSFHQRGEQFEILFNKTKYNALPPELKAIIDYAVQASSADMSWKAIDRNSKDYIELKTKDKVNFYKTPDAILRAQLDAWDKVIAAKAKENPLFQKVLDSQKAFAERAGQWQNDYMVDFKMAYNRYFAKGGQEGLSRSLTEQRAAATAALFLPGRMTQGQRCRNYCWPSTGCPPGWDSSSPGPSSC